MLKLILSMAIIVGALMLGQLFYLRTKERSTRQNTDSIMDKIRIAVVFIATPVISLGAFWIVDFSNMTLAALPILGATSLGIGAFLSVGASKLLKHNRIQTGSFFCCGSSTNLGTIGGLLCFAFFGEAGYSYCVLFCLLLTPMLYLFSFPGAAYFSSEGAQKGMLKRLMSDKLVIVFFISLVAGFALNIANVPRPAFYSTVNEYLIPVSSFFLVMSLGYTMRFSKIRQYKKEIAVMSIIKYVITPVFVIGAAYLLGFHNYGDGTLFKSLIILSALPVGFNALIPMNIYNLEVNLGNSCWIVTTLMMIAIIPAVYFAVQ